MQWGIIWAQKSQEKHLEYLTKSLGRYSYVSDNPDIGLRQDTLLFLVFLGVAIKEVYQLLQNHFAYADDFIALGETEDVVQ